MSILKKGRRNSDEDTELNMIPIMNIFLVIIPFLLTSVSFFHIKAISTSVPVMANSTDVSGKAEKIKSLVSFYGWIVKLASNTEAWSSTFSSIFNPSIHLIRSEDTSICCG